MLGFALDDDGVIVFVVVGKLVVWSSCFMSASVRLSSKLV